MPYREIIAVCSEIRTRYINTLCGQNVELLNVKPGGGDHWALKVKHSVRTAQQTHPVSVIKTSQLCCIRK